MAAAADYLTIAEVNRSIWAFVHGGREVDPWLKIQDEARSESQLWPSLKYLYNDSILSHDSLGSALANRLSKALGNSVSRNALFQLFKSYFDEDREIKWQIYEDLRAVSERYAPINSYLHTLLYSQGFLALGAQRVAHKLWSEGKGDMALFIQIRVSDVFAVDILPEEKIEPRMLIANALGVFDGNIIVGDSVAIFRGEAYVYRKILLADHPAKLVRHKLEELYKEYSSLKGAGQMLEFQGDVRKSMLIADGAAAPESKPGRNPQDGGVATTASVRQPHGGNQSSEDGDGQVPDHESNDPAPSPDVAEEASRNPSGEGERPPVPPGNSGDAEGQPPRDVEGLVPLQEQPADEARRLNLSTLATTCLAISGSVGIALPSIRFSTSKHLSGNVNVLLSSAEISTVVGFSLSLGGYMSLQRNRRGALPPRSVGLASRVLTGAGCAFTTCGFLLIMGTQLPEKVMLWVSGVSCIIPITVIPFLFKISA